MPPFTTALILPFVSLKQTGSVGVKDSVNIGGAALIVHVPVIVHPFASVTVKLYVPGARLVKSAEEELNPGMVELDHA